MLRSKNGLGVRLPNAVRACSLIRRGVARFASTQ
jgi:hypothetical protein